MNRILFVLFLCLALGSVAYAFQAQKRYEQTATLEATPYPSRVPIDPTCASQFPQYIQNNMLACNPNL